jgi:integrase
MPKGNGRHLLNRIEGRKNDPKLKTLLKTPGRYCDGGGLWLEVGQGNGQACWIFRFSIDGKQGYMGLGSAHAVGLKKARLLVAPERELVAQGINPKERRDTAREAARKEREKLIPFWDVVTQYHLTSTAHLSDSARQEWIDIMTREVRPTLGHLPIREIKRPEVFNTVLPLWLSKNAVAQKVLSYCRSVFELATNQGKYDAANPAGIKPSSFPDVDKAKQHQASLPHTQLRDFLVRLNALASENERYATRARMIEFTILTGSRIGTVEKARWSEFDLDAQVWKAPAANMKLKPKERKNPAYKHFHYPLSDRAVEILRSLPRGGDDERVFDGTTQGSLLHVYELLDARAEDGRRIVTHGFRTTVVTFLEDVLRAEPYLGEAILAHSLGKETMLAYRGQWGVGRFAERLEALQQFADYATGRTPSGNVVQLKAA